MTPQDLQLLQKDLDAGNLHKLIEQQLATFQKGKETICPTCTQPIYTHTSLRLEFGPPGLRQVAHFDATDCLVDFVNTRLKKAQYTITEL